MITVCAAASGDVLQKKDWHSDVWSEIVAVYGLGPEASFRVVRYSEFGERRWTEIVKPHEVALIKPAASITKKEARSGSIHLRDRKDGRNMRVWDTSLHAFSSASRFAPEVFVPTPRVRRQSEQVEPNAIAC